MHVTAGLTLLAAAIGVLGAVAVVWTGRRSDRGAATVVVRAGILVAGLSVLAAFGVVGAVSTSAFSVAHLLYLLVVVAVPIVGVGCGVAWWRDRARPAMGVVAVLLLVPGVLGTYATHIAPYRLREDRASVELPASRAPRGTLRIGVLSDLQLRRVTSYERGAIDRVMAQEPDLILIAGDLFQGSEAEFEQELPGYRAMLGRLHAPGGVFAVQGDVDGEQVEVLAHGTKVQVLDDEVATVQVAGRDVHVGGTRLAWWSDRSTPVYEQLEAAPAGAISILLSHRPDTVTRLAPGSRVDLTVAGHTHGGQIALPFLGPPVTLSELPRSIGAGGLHEFDGNVIYVSTGIGVERGRAPQVRFLTRPSYGIISLVGRGA